MDPVSRREFWDILTDLHLRGITLVVSTPYMDEAERCSRIGLIYQGQLVVCDTPEKVKTMTEGQLVTLTPADVRQAQVLLEDVDGVLEIQTYGEQLRVFTPDARKLMEQISTTFSAAGIEVHDMRQTRPRMEEAFISLIRRRRTENEVAPWSGGQGDSVA